MFHRELVDSGLSYAQVGAVGVLFGGFTEIVVLLLPLETSTPAPDASGSLIVQVTAPAAPTLPKVVPATSAAAQSIFFQFFMIG